eukprot:10384417-Alexandrium_andersonii.AAC.1
MLVSTTGGTFWGGGDCPQSLPRDIGAWTPPPEGLTQELASVLAQLRARGECECVSVCDLLRHLQ